MGSDDEQQGEISFVILGGTQKTVLFNKLRDAAEKYERHVHYQDVHYFTVKLADKDYTIEITDPGMARTGGREMSIKKADLAILYYTATKLSSLTRLHSLKDDLDRKQNMPIRVICDIDDVTEYDEEDSSTGISSQSEGYESDPDNEPGLRRRHSMEQIRKQSDDGSIAIDMGRQFASELGERCTFMQISSSNYKEADALLKELLAISKTKARIRSRSLIPGRLARRGKSRDTKVAPQQQNSTSTDYSSISGTFEKEDSPKRRKSSEVKNSKVCSIQ